MLKVEFEDTDLDRLEVDGSFTGGFGSEVVRGYRKVMQAVRAANDTRDLYRGGLRMEKLKGKRQHQHSIRINDQWRVIITVDGQTLRVIEIDDYH